MENVQIATQGNKVTLTFDASADLGRSASGKTTMVASTKGNHKLRVGDREISIGLNVFTK